MSIASPKVLLLLVYSSLVDVAGLHLPLQSPDDVYSDFDDEEHEVDAREQLHLVDTAYRTIREDPNSRDLSDEELRLKMMEMVNRAPGTRHNASKLLVLRKPEGSFEFSKTFINIDRTARSRDANPDPKVLFIVAVGQKHPDVFLENVGALRPGCCHFMVFPYNEASNQLWHSEEMSNKLALNGPSGYVNISVMGTTEGRKHEFVAQAVRSLGADILHYDWVMTVDDDIDFSRMNFTRFLEIAHSSGAEIVAPSMKFSRFWPTFMQPHGDPATQAHSDCKRSHYRYTNFVELQMPMFRPRALRVVTSKLYYPVIMNQSSSDWGMDNVWCNLIADELEKPPDEVCAVVDAEWAVHLDTRENGAADCINVTDTGITQADTFQAQFPKYYMNRFSVKTYKCCDEVSCVDPHSHKRNYRTGNKAKLAKSLTNSHLIDAYSALHRCGGMAKPVMEHLVLGHQTHRLRDREQHRIKHPW